MLKSEFIKRKNETDRVRLKYPERVPVMVFKSPGCLLSDIGKNKFLVPIDMTLSQFVAIIRQRINIKQDNAIFIFINNLLPPLSKTMISLYEEYKQNDGFLYIHYNGESTFGRINML